MHSAARSRSTWRAKPSRFPLASRSSRWLMPLEVCGGTAGCRGGSPQCGPVSPVENDPNGSKEQEVSSRASYAPYESSECLRAGIPRRRDVTSTFTRRPRHATKKAYASVGRSRRVAESARRTSSSPRPSMRARTESAVTQRSSLAHLACYRIRERELGRRGEPLMPSRLFNTEGRGNLTKMGWVK